MADGAVHNVEMKLDHSEDGFKPRTGRKIALLQKKTEPLIAYLGPNSPSARLEAVELGGALTWVLINFAFEQSSVQSLAPLESLEVVRHDFRKGSMRTYELEVEQEILLACYIAIGSRRSSHSAIIGNPMAPGHLGIKRETACRTLAQRAIDLLEKSNICSTPSIKNIEIISAVKEMIIGVYPDHPFSQQFSPILHAHRQALAAQGRFLTNEEELRCGFALYDARISAKLGVRPYLDDTAMLTYPWLGPDSLPDAILKLSQPSKYDPPGMRLTGWILTIQMALLRRVVLIVEEATFRPQAARTAFEYLWDMLDVATAFLQAKINLPRPPGSASRNDLLGQVPDVIMCECHLMRVAQLVAKLGDDWGDLQNMARVRFLKALRWLSEVLDSSHFTRAADIHWVARRLEMLELVDGWVNLAVEAVLDPLSEFGRDDLKRLLPAFSGASVVFASTSIRTDQLTAGLEKTSAEHQLERASIDARAVVMVQDAINSINDEYA